ncbi:MAG TPA: ABC transporter ATP-binding protein [Acidimicrobiia bacterium]
MTATLVCRGLRKAYGDLIAVDGVDFSIAPGETYGLLGPNGAGKTTTISMVAGILEPDAGTVALGAEPVSPGHSAVRSRIGYVPQDIAVYPDLTAAENLAFFGRLYGIDKATLAGRIEEVLVVIGLEDRAGDRTDQYSGGMKRRLNIGIGLLHEPELLILDEPTVGVDPQSRNAILESVEALGREGISVLYTTHYIEEAERLCDRVGIIDAGRIVAEGTQRELVGLVGELDRVRLDVSTGAVDLVHALEGLEGVHQVSAADSAVQLLVSDARSRLPAIITAASQRGIGLAGVIVTEPNLEAVFLHLTGKALRD